jgi:hypothetical protein
MMPAATEVPAQSARPEQGSSLPPKLRPKLMRARSLAVEWGDGQRGDGEELLLHPSTALLTAVDSVLLTQVASFLFPSINDPSVPEVKTALSRQLTRDRHQWMGFGSMSRLLKSFSTAAAAEEVLWFAHQSLMKYGNTSAAFVSSDAIIAQMQELLMV